MKKIILPIILIALFVSCSSTEKTTKEETKPEPKDKFLLQKQETARNYIERRKNNSNLYWGEGIAKIGDDIGAAKKKAKKNAIEDLSSQIKVMVKSDVTSTLKAISKDNAEGSFNEKIKETFSRKIELYTNTVIENREDRRFIDYPKAGYLTYFTDIKKDEYQKKVKRDLNQKKQKIITTVTSAKKEFETGNYMTALSNWISASKLRNQFFENLPVQEDLNNDGNNEDIQVYLKNRVNNFIGNIKLSFLENNINYDAQGELSEKPVIYAQYSGKSGKSKPISKLPLKGSFVEGNGEILGEIVTSGYGQDEILVKVNPSNRSTIVMFTVDAKDIRGLDNFSLNVKPETKLILSKTKTVAYSLKYNNQGKLTKPESLVNDLESSFLNKGYSTLEFPVSGNEPTSGEMQTITSRNADYLLIINLKTSKASTLGGYDNMYQSTISGSISLFKLPLGKEIYTENIGSAKGYGSTASLAGNEAFSKVKNSVRNKISNVIGKIQ